MLALVRNRCMTITERAGPIDVRHSGAVGGLTTELSDAGPSVPDMKQERNPGVRCSDLVRPLIHVSESLSVLALTSVRIPGRAQRKGNLGSWVKTNRDSACQSLNRDSDHRRKPKLWTHSQ